MTTYLYPAELPNELKGVLRDSCFHIIRYAFECSRSLNDLGLPYGPTLPSTLEFTCKARKVGKIKSLYQLLSKAQTGTYTFLIGPVFSDSTNASSKYLISYDEVMTVRGNLIDIVDVYSTKDNDEANQMIVTAKLLINEIVFGGGETSKNRILKTY